MDKKDLFSELNKCQDISKYSEKVRYIMENRKKYHKECEALEEYLTLHNKENPTKEQKFLKAKLKAELERFLRVLEVTSELEIPTATQFAVGLLRAMDCPFFLDILKNIFIIQKPKVTGKTYLFCILLVNFQFLGRKTCKIQKNCLMK